MTTPDYIAELEGGADYIAELESSSGVGKSPTRPAMSPEAIAAHARKASISVSRAQSPVMAKAADIAAGATSLMRGGLNIVGQAFKGSKWGDQIFPIEAVDKQSMSYLAGSLADPVALGIGQGAFNAVGRIPQLANLGRATPIVQGMTGGAATGALTGAINDDGSAGVGALVGGVAGGGIPALGMGAKKIADVARPFFGQSGAQAAGGKMMLDVSGTDANRVIRDLRTAPTPYAQPNVAQATAGLQNPKIAAMQAIADLRNAVPGTERVLAQRGERSGLLGSFAGTDAEIAALEASRKAAMSAGVNEAQSLGLVDRAVREATVMPPKPVTTTVKSNLQPGMTVEQRVAGNAPIPRTAPILEKLRENPLASAAIEDAKSLARGNLGLPDDMPRLTAAEIDDILADPMKSIKGLQLVKFAIDNRLSPSMSQSASAQVKVKDSTVTNVKNALMRGIEQTGSGGERFLEANKEFAAKSGEIFQKRAGQSMLNKLQAPLGTGETPSTLARALEKETGLIKEAGGFARKGLDAQLTPQNAAKVERVIKQLDTDTSLYELARRGAADDTVRAVTGEHIELPHVMSQSVTLANNAMRRIFGAGQIRTLRELAITMQDPQKMAVLMEQATAREQNAIKFLNNSMRYYSPYASAQAGKEAR